MQNDIRITHICSLFRIFLAAAAVDFFDDDAAGDALGEFQLNQFVLAYQSSPFSASVEDEFISRGLVHCKVADADAVVAVDKTDLSLSLGVGCGGVAGPGEYVFDFDIDARTAPFFKTLGIDGPDGEGVKFAAVVGLRRAAEQGKQSPEDKNRLQERLPQIFRKYVCKMFHICQNLSRHVSP